MESVAPVSRTARKNLIPDFHEDPENQVLFFGAAPLLLILKSTPAAMRDLAIQAKRLFLELFPSGVALSPGGRFLGSPAAGRVRKSHCHVFLGGLDPGQAPLKTLLLMLRQT